MSAKNIKLVLKLVYILNYTVIDHDQSEKYCKAKILFHFSISL